MTYQAADGGEPVTGYFNIRHHLKESMKYVVLNES